MTTISQLLKFKLDALQSPVSIVDNNGRPSLQFQRLWQKQNVALVDSIVFLAEVIDDVFDARLASGAAMATAQEALAEALAEKIGSLPRYEPISVGDDLTPRHEPRESIELLHDVDIDAPVNGEVLTFQNGVWVNQVGGGGGGGVGYPPQLGYMGWGNA